MPSRRARWLIGLAALQLVLLVITFPLSALGTQPWHHLASLAAVLVIAWVFRGPLQHSRAALALGVLTTSILAAASGFYLLYWKAGVRVGGYQDWGVFWHIVWSWFAAVFFVQHTWINRVQFVHFVSRSLATARGAAVHLGAYVLALAALAVTALPVGRAWFTNANYVPLSLYTWALAIVPAYLAWLLHRLRRRNRHTDRARDRTLHWQVRRPLDLALVPMATAVVLSGLPLFLLGDQLDAAGLKYASKFWHTGPSVLFSVLAFVHGVQAWRAVQAHWRKLG